MKVLINNGTGNVDYTRYVVDGTLSIEDSINVPTLTNFILSPSDNSFVIPKRSAYVTVVSERYASGSNPINGNGYGSGKILATGFVTNEPEREYLGINPKLTSNKFQNQQLSYKINVTSDEWLLNSHVVPFIPAFVNQTMGQILAGIANALLPGFFDVTSHVMSGDLVPYYQYDPQQTFSDIAKSFGDSVRYRYKVINRTLYFVPFGDAPLGIQYDENVSHKGFSRLNFPLELQTSVLTVPPVNDCIVIGDIEPQTNWENYFIGDGFTSRFRLKHDVFDGSTAALLQDDWTEGSFQTNLWNVVVNGTQDYTLGGVFDLAGSLSVTMASGGSVPLNTTYIVENSGLELGGGLNLQHGEFEFTDVCTGIVGGIYSSTTLTQANCIAGFQLSASGTGVTVTASGAGGIVIQPLYNGQLVGPKVVSQPNHHYLLQTWIGANKWDRYERVYRNLTGNVAYGGNQLAASGTITWAITDIDQGIYANTPPQFQSPYLLDQIVNPITKFTLQQQNIQPFAVYSPINAQQLNLDLWYTLLAQPPEGSLYVKSLTGATGLQLPVLPPQLWTASTPPDQKLGPEIHYLMGFGQQNQTATITVQGDAQFLEFYDDTIPGVGARIRHQSWAAEQSISRVQDPIAVAQEACVSGDDGIRSAILTNLNPLPRTSQECEDAAGAAIHDREFPQFQGTYTIETLPYKFETLYNPGIYDYPTSGRFFYVNSPVRAVSGDNFIVNTSRISVIELREEALQISLDYGPDLYLEKLLASFEQRADKLLRPTETAPPIDFVHLAQVGNAFLPMLDNAQVVNIQNDAVTGNSVTIDLGVVPNGWVAEVRRVDSGWGTLDQNELGRFSTQQFTLQRIQRDQTFYIRQLDPISGKFSRFSKALRVAYPFPPSPPQLLSLTRNGVLVLGYNGWVPDIYGVELRLPSVSGSYIINYPIVTNGGQQQNVTGPSEETNYFQRQSLVNDTQPWNTRAMVPQMPGFGQTFQFQTGDIVQVQSAANSSFNGLKVITGVSNTPGNVPTLVQNANGNYVDMWFWNQNPGGGQFNNQGLAFPLNTATAVNHTTGNSLLYNPVRLGQGVNPYTDPIENLVWHSDDVSFGWQPSSSLIHDWEMAAVCRLFVPVAGTYTFIITHDDGMFFGMNGGATRISGPNSPIHHANTAVMSYPVLGGIDQDASGGGFFTDTYIINFPTAGNYDFEIDYYQRDHGNNLTIFASPVFSGQTFDILPGYLQELDWFDVGQTFPVQAGTAMMPFTHAGTVQLAQRGPTAAVTSGSVSNGIATINTASAHGFNAGDVICVGCRVTPLSAAGGSNDASPFTGQWTLSSVTSTSFTFTAAGSLPQNLASVNLIGQASQLLANPNPSAPPASGQLVTLNAVGTLIQKPVFAPSDLQFDLTDPQIRNVISVAQTLNPSGFTINAYFFNLMWDYSIPLNLTQVTVPTISGLIVDPYTQSVRWTDTSGQFNPATGYRITVTDPTGAFVLNQYTIDHPHNYQPVQQAQLTAFDFQNGHIINVTPFNALSDGIPLSTLHTPFSASGFAIAEDYRIGSVVNGYVSSGQVIVRNPFDQAVNYSVDMVPSQAWIDQPPSSGTLVFSIQQFTLGINGGNTGTEIGCLTFTAGSHVGTYTVPAGGAFAVGDCLKFICTTQVGSGDGAGIGLSVVGTKVFSQNPQAPFGF